MQATYRKILMVSDANLKPQQLYVDQVPKMAKGFIRLGHDVRQLSYTGIMAQLSPFKSRTLNYRLYKRKTDEVICRYVKQYKPDIIFIGFSRGIDVATVQSIRAAAPVAVLFGWDGDPWPANHPGRIPLGCALDVLFATNNGSFLEEYREAGAKKCIFMPNLIDPDNDHRYAVETRWQSDILWTGKVQHQSGIEAGEFLRQQVLELLAGHPGTRMYGCEGHQHIGGIDYLYAISGARIGISINAINTVPLYHSDRFTHYSACGTLVLAKRVPGTDTLMQDNRHVRYFDCAEECMELARWYLAHEDARKKIADEGMQYCHDHFNAVRMVGYMLDVFESGQYEAPWGKFL